MEKNKMSKNKNYYELLELNKIKNENGNITIIEKSTDFKFNLNRVYFLSNVPSGITRGGHAHKKLHQLIIPINGSFDIKLDNGKEKKSINLNNESVGLRIYPMTWREISNFSPGSICLVLASEEYDENDYIRKYDEFLELINNVNEF